MRIVPGEVAPDRVPAIRSRTGRGGRPEPLPTTRDRPGSRRATPHHRRARSTSASQAVMTARGSAAACRIERLRGLSASSRTSTAEYSASEPCSPPTPPVMPKTSSPTLNSVTSLPTAATTPARSIPSTAGSETRACGAVPSAILRSRGFTPLAHTCISAWPFAWGRCRHSHHSHRCDCPLEQLRVHRCRYGLHAARLECGDLTIVSALSDAYTDQGLAPRAIATLRQKTQSRASAARTTSC